MEGFATFFSLERRLMGWRETHEHGDLIANL